MLIALGLNSAVIAQITPQPSSTQTIVQDFGLGKITVNYSRPSMKGRKVFGALEPFDKVWRTGANSATVLTFTDAVNFGGTEIPAGEYGLFTIPNKTEWTVILSKAAKQWGAYKYEEAKDALRVDVKTKALPATQETLVYKINSNGFTMDWDKISVPVEIK